jgi:hypothetical protein
MSFAKYNHFEFILFLMKLNFSNEKNYKTGPHVFPMPMAYNSSWTKYP